MTAYAPEIGTLWLDQERIVLQAQPWRHQIWGLLHRSHPDQPWMCAPPIALHRTQAQTIPVPEGGHLILLRATPPAESLRPCAGVRPEYRLHCSRGLRLGRCAVPDDAVNAICRGREVSVRVRLLRPSREQWNRLTG